MQDNDFPVEVQEFPREQAEQLRHDSVPPPSKDQRERWIKQLEDEEQIPFTDGDS